MRRELPSFVSRVGIPIALNESLTHHYCGHSTITGPNELAACHLFAHHTQLGVQLRRKTGHTLFTTLPHVGHSGKVRKTTVMHAATRIFIGASACRIVLHMDESGWLSVSKRVSSNFVLNGFH